MKVRVLADVTRTGGPKANIGGREHFEMEPDNFFAQRFDETPNGY